MAGMIPVSHSKPAEVHEGEASKRRDLYIRLREIFQLEQLEQFAMICSHLQQLAVERRAQMRITIIFSDKGFPFVLEVMESVRFVKPMEKRNDGEPT